MQRFRPAGQLYERIISKGPKGIEEFELYLRKMALDMMQQDQPPALLEQTWAELDALITYFLAKSKTYILNENHRVYLLQSLQSIGFALEECRQVTKYFEPVARAILSYFTDASQKVRLAAIGGMYNFITKYMEQARILFIQTFERLSILIADPSGQIRQAATFLSKALKTMVHETVFEQSALNLRAFVELLAERLQSGGNLAKQYMLEWLTAIEEVPQFQISFDLPLFFRQVFELFLSKTKSLKTKAEECLKKFLHVFRQILVVQGKLSSKLSNESTQVLLQMILLLVRQNLSADISFHALEWLEVFTKFYSLELTKGFEPFMAPIYSAMLRDIILVVISTLSDDSERIRKISSRINEALLLTFPLIQLNKKNIERASQLLEGLLAESKVSLRVEAIVRWIKLFLDHRSQYLLAQIHRIMELLIEKMCDRTATKSLFQLIEGSLFIQKYYDDLVQIFLAYLCSHDKVPIEPIFRQILALQDAENHFLAICKKIECQTNRVFQYHLIESLITVLVSEHRLENLRIKLSAKEENKLFTYLFSNFNRNESAALILCFLGGRYYLAKSFIQLLGGQERLSSHNFRSLMRMSNLMEHSNMNHLRADLRHNETALMAYLSLLMVLPFGKCSGLLLQRIPPHMAQFEPGMAQSQQQQQMTANLLQQYRVRTALPSSGGSC